MIRVGHLGYEVYHELRLSELFTHVVEYIVTSIVVNMEK